MRNVFFFYFDVHNGNRKFSKQIDHIRGLSSSRAMLKTRSSLTSTRIDNSQFPPTTFWLNLDWKKRHGISSSCFYILSNAQCHLETGPSACPDHRWKEPQPRGDGRAPNEESCDGWCEISPKSLDYICMLTSEQIADATNRHVRCPVCDKGPRRLLSYVFLSSENLIAFTSFPQSLVWPLILPKVPWWTPNRRVCNVSCPL